MKVLDLTSIGLFLADILHLKSGKTRVTFTTLPSNVCDFWASKGKFAIDGRTLEKLSLTYFLAALLNEN